MLSVGSRAAPQGAATVDRAAEILLLFANSPEAQLGVTGIAHSLGLSKSAVHRILVSFRRANILELDPDSHRYSLGPAALSLGFTYLIHLGVRQAASRELTGLSKATAETALLAVRTGGTWAYIDQVTPNRKVLASQRIGVPHDLHIGAPSKAFLAFMDPEEGRGYLGRIPTRTTCGSPVDPAHLGDELALVRKEGWAQSFGEDDPGVASVAAPILDAGQSPVAVVSVCGPVQRMAGKLQLCVRELQDCIGRIAAQGSRRSSTESDNVM